MDATFPPFPDRLCTTDPTIHEDTSVLTDSADTYKMVCCAKALHQQHSIAQHSRLVQGLVLQTAGAPALRSDDQFIICHEWLSYLTVLERLVRIHLAQPLLLDT